MYKIITIILIFITTAAFSQELNCKVTVNSDQVQSSDKRVFTDMENAFSQFLNSRKWTNDTYESFERIKCNIIITLQNPTSIGSYQATVQVQSARPVYNSNYETIVLNFADRDWTFEYVESQPLQFNENTFTSNLTSLLAFYANIIIGMDYDTFSPMGGNLYFQKALEIATNAQQSNRPGWNSLGSNRNRYFLIENLNNPQLAPVREGTYKYHRLALDTFDQDKENSRKEISEVLKTLEKTRTNYPNSILIISFLDAKGDELVNMFSEGNIQVRRQAYDILTKIDPSQSTSYEKIIK
ncbi:DUF4835 family protein [Fulvivirga ligni]|uniref:type IX secretion system protein PorD n=1 Tax=Fulvivirga ligni TaxID=2904246 RepID=UPI001F468EDC|nr:DUF4835 family protein [Fulvivirga ligni]UII21429.1 DUF4835 family protein [Fulvivirga ligni]